MCLITEQQSPFIAKKDIIVYKILCNDLRPYYNCIHGNSKPYILRELNETTIEETNDYSVNGDLDEEFFTNKYGVYWRSSRRDFIKSFGPGFHAYMNKKVLNHWIKYYKFIKNTISDKSNVVVECTIPKGGEYYKNEVGLIVSNKIIINKIIKL